MSDFLLALQFLTIIPINLKSVKENALAQPMIYFPLVGAILGWSFGWLDNIFSIWGFNHLAISVIIFAVLTIFTGGLHLDGLSDTFDGLGCRGDKEKVLAVMRDSSTGSFGVMAIVFALFLKVSFFYSISFMSKSVALVLMCTVSRYAMGLMIGLFPYARVDGKAKAFIDGVNLKILCLSGVIAAVIVFLALKWMGLLILVVTLIVAYGFTWGYAKKINGITGDVLGSVNELCEIIVLGLCVFISQGGMF